jgi:hypothetical protein
MTSLASTAYQIAAADLGTTLAGIAFWVVLLAAYLALFAATLVSVARAPLTKQSQTRWIWGIVLAPALGILLWLTIGRPTEESA